MILFCPIGWLVFRLSLNPLRVIRLIESSVLDLLENTGRSLM